MEGLAPDRVLDCYGLLCPMPVRRTAEALEKMEVGQLLKVIATDDWFGPDLEAWLKGRPHSLLSLSTSRDAIHAFIRKTA